MELDRLKTEKSGAITELGNLKNQVERTIHCRGIYFAKYYGGGGGGDDQQGK